MLRPSVRRLFVGLVVVGLLATATPAQASGFWFEGGLQMESLWTRAWSWLADLLVADSRATANPDHEKVVPGQSGPPPPGQRGRPQGTNGGGGDGGGGIDPDG